MTDWLITVLTDMLLIQAVIAVSCGFLRRKPIFIVNGLFCAAAAFGLATGRLEDLSQLVVHALTGASRSGPRLTTGHGGSSADWGALVRYLGYVVAAGLVGLAMAAASRRHSRRRAERRRTLEARAAEAARWDGLHADHDAVRDAYGAYRMDVLTFLDRPALDDAAVPQTAAFLQAMYRADDARRGEDLAAYRSAVGDLRVAWKAADAHARRVGTSAHRRENRHAIKRARKALCRAQDSAGGPHEQRLAMAKARDLLDGIVDLPQEAVMELEASHRLSLTKDAQTSS
ncbi:hypothetical protein [Streptomyces decoyicus]|uniref:hypothetical protein n=1 Tax=Streptomyces decoyicus TaxID=249567 RepID=UPI003654111B